MYYMGFTYLLLQVSIFSPLKPQRTLVPSFHHLSSIFPPFFDLHVIHLIYQVKGISGHQWVCVGCVRVCVGVLGCARVCAGVRGCAQVCAGVSGCVRICMGVWWVCTGVGESTRACAGVHRCAWVCVIVRRCAQICTGVRMHVWDEFSEFLPENRVPTSADFNTYPIRIFCRCSLKTISYYIYLKTILRIAGDVTYQCNLTCFSVHSLYLFLSQYCVMAVRPKFKLN